MSLIQAKIFVSKLFSLFVHPIRNFSSLQRSRFNPFRFLAFVILSPVRSRDIADPEGTGKRGIRIDLSRASFIVNLDRQRVLFRKWAKVRHVVFTRLERVIRSA